MNILISNDDGVQARGLQELARALHQDAGASIYVCAPDGQRSASGHGITMNERIEVSEVILDNVEIAYQTSGLPADCVKIGMEFFPRAGVHIDMMFSGINHGGNLGTDTLYSGTVSAALEGSICGVPSVAVSVDSHKATHFDYACELAVNAARALEKQIREGTANHQTVLNINVPDVPKDQVKGLRYTSLGERKYTEEFISMEDGGEVELPGSFQYGGTPIFYHDLPERFDVIAHQSGYATITPIHIDLTDYDMIDEIKTWGLG